MDTKKRTKFRLSDLEIREIIRKSICVILPIKNTLQPSGQSVALQAIACKTPLFINYFDGLWDKEFFKNNKTCYLIKENSTAKNWVKQIKLFLDKKVNRSDIIAKNAYKIFVKKEPYNNYLEEWSAILNEN